LAHRAGTRPAEACAPKPGFLPIWSCSVWGLPCPLHYWGGGALLPHLFTLTLTSPPGRYVFCGTFRQLVLTPVSRTLSGTLLCGVRTFLPPHPEGCGERPSGPAAYSNIIFDGAARTGLAPRKPVDCARLRTALRVCKIPQVARTLGFSPASFEFLERR
jgi:hypothetical protein